VLIFDMTGRFVGEVAEVAAGRWEAGARRGSLGIFSSPSAAAHRLVIGRQMAQRPPRPKATHESHLPARHATSFRR
jgi:hypothetical protein